MDDDVKISTGLLHEASANPARYAGCTSLRGVLLSGQLTCAGASVRTVSLSIASRTSDRTPARGIHRGELFALEINHSRSKPAMPANPAADFRGIDQPKNIGAERVAYRGRTRFCVCRMKAEPCFVGKASPVLR